MPLRVRRRGHRAKVMAYPYVAGRSPLFPDDRSVHVSSEQPSRFDRASDGSKTSFISVYVSPRASPRRGFRDESHRNGLTIHSIRLWACHLRFRIVNKQKRVRTGVTDPCRLRVRVAPGPTAIPVVMNACGSNNLAASAVASAPMLVLRALGHAAGVVHTTTHAWLLDGQEPRAYC